MAAGPSILASCLGVLAFDFFFVPPYFTFAVSDTQYIFTFVVMLATGLLISTLTSRLTFQAELARRREQQAAALERAVAGPGRNRRAGAPRPRPRPAGAHARRRGVPARRRQDRPQAERRHCRWSSVSPGELDPHERAVADWVFKHGQPAGLGTDTLPSVSAAVRAAGDGGRACRRARRPAQRQTVDAVFARSAATDRGGRRPTGPGGRSASARPKRPGRAQLRYEREQLRSALLSAVSHDLRTPLAAIAGAGSTLAESGHAMSARNAQGAGRVDRRRDRPAQPPGRQPARHDAAGSGQHAARPRLASARRSRRRGRCAASAGCWQNHRLTIDLPRDLPLVYLDELLFHQVLVESAGKRRPLHAAGARDHRSAAGQARAQRLWLEVADTGPGFPPGDEERIFEKFYRGRTSASPLRHRPGPGDLPRHCRVARRHDPRRQSARRRRRVSHRAAPAAAARRSPIARPKPPPT